MFRHYAVLIAFFIYSLGPLPVLAQPVSAGGELYLPAPGTMVNMTPKFDPMIVKGIKLYPDNPFKFDFIVDTGDLPLNKDQIKEQGQKLAAYFLASLTIPEKEMWVNLSPYEKSRIIPSTFGDTQMGKELLSEDYMLKQIMATALYPERELGKEFWQKVYAQAGREFGTTNVPVNTFNKVWIVPDQAVVYENEAFNSVFVVESRLKVMLEKDYLAANKHKAIEQYGLSSNVVPASSTVIPDRSSVIPEKDPHAGHSQELAGIQDTSSISDQIIREIVIPALEKEVNEGKNFATLRQVYHALILAAWYKKNLKDNVLAKGYVDRGKTLGVDTEDKQIIEKIYKQYLSAYRKGVYNYIKEELDPATQQMIPRKYFSGGMVMAVANNLAMVPSDDSRVADMNAAMRSKSLKKTLMRIAFVVLLATGGSSILNAAAAHQLTTAELNAQSLVSAQILSRQMQAEAGTRQIVPVSPSISQVQFKAPLPVNPPIAKAPHAVLHLPKFKNANQLNTYYRDHPEAASPQTVQPAPHQAVTPAPSSMENPVSAPAPGVASATSQVPPIVTGAIGGYPQGPQFQTSSVTPLDKFVTDIGNYVEQNRFYLPHMDLTAQVKYLETALQNQKPNSPTAIKIQNILNSINGKNLASQTTASAGGRGGPPEPPKTLSGPNVAGVGQSPAAASAGAPPPQAVKVKTQISVLHAAPDKVGVDVQVVTNIPIAIDQVQEKLPDGWKLFAIEARRSDYNGHADLSDHYPDNSLPPVDQWGGPAKAADIGLYINGQRVKSGLKKIKNMFVGIPGIWLEKNLQDIGKGYIHVGYRGGEGDTPGPLAYYLPIINPQIASNYRQMASLPNKAMMVNHKLPNGGIDLEKLILNTKGGGVRTAFSDPRILQMMLDAKGLFPQIQSITPVTVPMVSMLLGINTPPNDNNPAHSPAKQASNKPSFLKAALIRMRYLC
jgi:hypothetical protein